MSAVFREMTCLCTNAARLGSQAACPGAVPLHFWLTLPSRACRSLAGSQEQGRPGPKDVGQTQPPGRTARTCPLCKAASPRRPANRPVAPGRIPSQRESQSNCHQSIHSRLLTKPGDGWDPGGQDWPTRSHWAPKGQLSSSVPPRLCLGPPVSRCKAAPSSPPGCGFDLRMLHFRGGSDPQKLTSRKHIAHCASEP